ISGVLGQRLYPRGRDRPARLVLARDRPALLHRPRRCAQRGLAEDPAQARRRLYPYRQQRSRPLLRVVPLRSSSTGRCRSVSAVIIHTDGACSGNPGPGGWGAVLQYGTTIKELKGGAPLTTNNQMELTAAIEA